MAAAGFVRFEYNPAGYRAIRRSDAVRQILEDKAHLVAATAQRETPDNWVVRADSGVGPNRASATVFGVPLWLERRRRVLGRAMDAAR